MDAVSLAVPTNTLANAAMAGCDKAALPGEGDAEGVAIDFATLLAAGLDLQQQTPVQSVPDADAAAKDTAGDDPIDPSALAADPSQLNVTPPALPTPPTIAEHIAQSAQHAGHEEAKEAKLQAAGTLRDGAKAPPLAASAANLAGKTEDKATAHEAPHFQAELVKETQALVGTADSQRTDAAAEAAAHALNLQSVEQRPAPQQPTAVLEVSAPVSSSGFADALSQQVVWMVDKDAQVAELRINPPELGPVEVRLTVNGDQASAQFVSTHSEVREALETSIARLRESFAEAGIQLGQASVSAESFREQSSGQSDARTAGGQQSGYGNTHALNDAGTPAAPLRVRRGLVDTFA